MKLLVILTFFPWSLALDNGLALTPPMGWLTWQRYRCTIDCDSEPENCISERLIRRQSDCLVENGFLEAGYQYVTIDDCWSATTRDALGKLQPDPIRFPSGIKSLADYVHSKGLKFGIYLNFGTETCAGYPGSQYYMETDAQTLAEWEVDYLKFDGCNSDIKDAPEGYPAMTRYLNLTGRPIVYSCEWPYRNWQNKIETDYSAVRNTCNMWRFYKDVQDSWSRVMLVIDFFVKHNNEFQPFAGPGGWNDPDMLVIGNTGLSHDEERAQMALWAVLASPLIISLDACNVRAESKAILQNKNVIAVNQDKLGIQGTLKTIQLKGKLQIWTRPILPSGSFAIVVLNLKDGGVPIPVRFTFSDLDMFDHHGYNVTEVFEGKHVGFYASDDVFSCRVNMSGAYMIKAVPRTGGADVAAPTTVGIVPNTAGRNIDEHLSGNANNWFMKR